MMQISKNPQTKEKIDKYRELIIARIIAYSLEPQEKTTNTYS